MNKDWSAKNKEIQGLLSKESTFGEAIEKLIEFRDEMFQQITWIIEGYPEKAFYQLPFAGAKGYHSKTLAYSIWHIFRIEDIVAHEMLAGDEQKLFCDDHLSTIASPIITTGNELEGEEIVEFSKKLNVQSLYLYAEAVKESTEQILLQLQYKDLKAKFSEGTKQKLIESKCVSKDENAFWLIDYWCGKDIKGLIQMPFSLFIPQLLKNLLPQILKHKKCLRADIIGLHGYTFILKAYKSGLSLFFHHDLRGGKAGGRCPHFT